MTRASSGVFLQLLFKMAPPPNVTGLSPNEGLPGTRVKIRGENLGQSPTDLIGLTICGCDCLLSAEWKSPNQIIAISGIGKGKGDIVVTTKSGGVGTCSVNFKGHVQGKIGLTTPSAVWVEESAVNYRGIHSLSPGSFEQEDPLGLSVEANDKKFPENLQELVPDASGDITSENFSPIWFLLENHHATTFNDLQAGLLHLRRKVEGQKEGQLMFLKANVAPVMDQIDTINILKDKFNADIKEYNSEPTTLKLQKAIKDSERQARKLFDDVLTRRDRAEKRRNALNVLARFRFLFCLPCVMERNIKKGDYDIVINDYMRVKNLFNKTDVPVFRAALSEIEKRVVGLQKMLHEKLVKMPISVEEQKRLIRYLVHLESPYEPAWDAIKSHSDYITLRIKECYDDHKSAEAALIEELAKLKHSNSASKYSKYNAVTQDLNTSPPENVLYIEDLCQVITELFPDLWKIGQSYFTGELHVKVEGGRQVGFKHIVLTIMETYCKSLRAAIIPHTLDKSVDKSTYGTWMVPELDVIAMYLPDCLRYVRATYSVLIKLDLPSEPLDIVFGIIMDLRIHCMSVLFKQSIEEVKQLSKMETWRIEFTSTHSGITRLPIKFEQIVQKVIQVVRESVLTSEQREGPFLDNSQAHKELDKQVEGLLLAFHDVLKNLAFREDLEDDDDHLPVVSQLIGTPTNAYRNHNSRHIPVWEHRLLTTLSNCQYTNSKVLQGLSDLFTKSGYPTPKMPIENVKSKLDALEKSILEAYLEQKSDPLVGTIEPSMYLGRFDWDTNVTPTDIRPYAKECINNLIHIQSEVNSISPVLVDQVLPHIVQTIAEELYRLMSCVQMFSVAGTQQARADVTALEEIFKHYTTAKAQSYFKEALEVIPVLQKADLLVVEDILKQCRLRMHLQIVCLACNERRQNGLGED